ncbi:MAG TPA: amidohydrolase family protein [Vicinamibacterales bacterium]|nr:amidohydrolase family protein [Vicinamibacterales bacterium]
MPPPSPILASVAGALLIATWSLQATQSPDTVVRFGRLWTGTETISPGVVVIRGDRIAGLGGADYPVPAGARIIDLSRYTGLPGLIDLHTHMTYYWDRQPGTRPLGQRRNPAVTVYLAQDNARATLETGVTTVRDLGASNDTDLAMRDLIAMGRMVGPRMFVSGQGISAGRRGAPGGPDAMRETTRLRLQTAADWIKVYGSRGSFQSVETTQTVTFEEMQAIVETAHAAGRKVAIHSYGASGVRDAVRAGADSVEHGIDLDDETLREMTRRGTVWVPTVDHNRYYIDARDEYGFAPESIAPLEAYIQANLESVRRAVRAGVRLGMGSDAVFSMFGQNTRELSWFVKAGLSPEQALATATTTAADVLGVADRLGRIAPGYVADLVAVEGNPLADIDTLFAGVRWVMKDGRVVVERITRAD